MTDHNRDALAPVDLDRFACLADGGAETHAELVTVFIEALHEQLESMSLALCDGNLDAVTQTAHTAGGAASMCGALHLADLLLAVETAAREHRSHGLCESLERAQAEFTRVSTFLRSTVVG